MTDIEKEYLQERVKNGQRYEIALEVWREFINARRAKIMDKFSSGDYSYLDDTMAELRVLKLYEENSQSIIKEGERVLRRLEGDEK